MIKPLTKKILLAIALVAILAAAFWWGGHTPGSQDQLAADANSADTSRQPAADTPDLSTDQEPAAAIEGAAPDMSNSASPSEEQKTPNSQKDEAESQSSGHGNTDTNNTAPTAANQDVWTCSLAVRCDTILDHLDYLNEAKRELIPSDGVIFSSSNVIFSEGESVLDVLLREMQSAGIPMEYVNTPGIWLCLYRRDQQYLRAGLWQSFRLDVPGQWGLSRIWLLALSAGGRRQHRDSLYL